MKAAVYRKYGPPETIQLADVPKPVPGSKDILIKIHATTVTMGDCEMRAFRMPPLLWLPVRLAFGVFRPRNQVLGQELSGVVVAVGKEVTKFKLGDEVFAPTDMKLGAYAEYRCLHQDHAVALKPKNMSFEEAATIPTGGLNALHFLRLAKIKKGERVLIIGAGGSIGTYGVQLAKFYGAEVTAVDSMDKLDMLSEIGADHVLDYTEEDITQMGKTYDVIFDIVCKSPLEPYLDILNNGGRYLAANLDLKRIFKSLRRRLKGDKKVITGVADYKQKDSIYLKQLVQEGHLKAVIDRAYSLDEIVEAHRYVDTGAKKGNVVVTIAE